MRKISKSRAEDEVVSSTNGSIGAEDQQEAERSDPVEEEEEDQDSISNDDKKENESTSSIKRPAKKRKSKGKKKKSVSNKSVTEEEYEDENSKDEDAKPEKKKKSSKKDSKAPAKRSKADVDESEDENEEYEVEKVIDSKKIKGKLHYLIRWKGYSKDSDTWEPENTLSCPELINKFNDEKENSKEDAKSGKGKKRKASNKQTKVAAKRPKNDFNESGDENAEYEVERILEVRFKKNNKREFLIHWKGWSNRYDSWEPEDNLNCPELINKFMEKVSKAKSVEARNLRMAPVTTNRYTLQDPASGRRLSKRRGQTQRVRYDDAE